MILVGASQESYLDRVLFGNIPQAVAALSPIPTIITRRQVGGMRVGTWLRRAGWRLFHALPTLDLSEQIEIYKAIREGAQPKVDFFVMIALAAAIATFGLLQNSPAVIIGAMLVAPLMAAIFGLSLGVVRGDLRLLRRAGSATLRGMLLAIAVGRVAWASRASSHTSVQVVIRRDTNPAAGILAALRDEPADLLVLGWRGKPGQGRYLVGRTLDALVQNAPCDVIVAPLGADRSLPPKPGVVRRVLVPVSGKRRLALDLGVALASGAAGAYALSRKGVSAALPGVAIAAALVPPLATVGIGLSLGQGQIAGGALLLFLTNLVAIIAAGGLVFLWLGFRPLPGQEARTRVFQGGAIGIVLLLVAVTIPLGILTAQSVRQAYIHRSWPRWAGQEARAYGRTGSRA